jgi:superfamily II DNA helicase RecQ
MLVLMHLSGGQPARGTELVTVQFRNGNDGDARGIFIEDGMVVFVTRYNKTSAISAKSKVIHRYLPHEVGQLVVYYIWLALPFWRLLGQTATRGRVADRSPFIWAPAPDKAWDFPGSQGQSAQKGRAGRTRGGEANEGGGEDREEQDSMDKIFKPEAWDTDKVRRALQRVTTRYTGEKLSILSWRHAAKAIYRRYIRDRDVLQLVERTDMEQDEESSRPGGREAADHQGGHTGQIGEMIYGRSVGEALDSTEAKRIGFRRVSREWHAFLLFDSTVQELKGQGSGKRAGSDMSRSLPLPLPLRLVDTRQQAAREEERRWAQARQVDIQHELEAMLGPDARFRGVQEEALAAIMRQESPVVVVMGTGGGKSMMFMLPARCSSGMTIVVVPLVSLRGNMRERCEELGIESVEWNAQRPQEWASVVFVTPEAAVGETFGHFINRQRAMGRLDRIVIDECHVVLDSGPGGAWRPGMLALRTLTRAEVQMVYLTATLRPADEDMFSQLMGVPTSSETSARTSTGKGMGGVWFRAPTTRPNIRYRIERFNRQRETEEAALKRVVSTAKSKHEGQIIVYCDTVGRTERYARVLGAVCYHRTVGSEEEKRQIVQALRAGQQRVFTATNALGLGVDAAGIRTVVHVGLVRSLRDYVQESGRAGRDGSASEAIIVRAATRAGKRATGDDGEETWEGKKAGVEKVMWEFVEGEGCMRAVLDREMDGWTGPRRCRVGEGEAACQRCHADRTEWFAQAQASDDGVREDVERTDEEEEEGEEFPSDSDVGMIVRHGSFPTSATPQSRQDGAEFEGHSIPSSIPSSITRSITRSTPTSPPTTPETASRAAVQRGVSSSAGSPHGRGRQLARQVNRQGMAEQERSGSKRGRDDPSQAEADMIRDIERKRIQRGVQAGRERAREASQAEEVMELEQMVGVYEEGCIWCRACGDKTEETVLGHRFGACEDEEAWKVRSIIQEVGRCIRWEKNSGCFGCGLPARMCDSWVEIGQTGLYGQGRGGCRKGFVIGVMVALYGAWGSEASAIFGQGMKRYGMQFDETKRPNTEWMEWLGKKIRWGGLESNEACRAMVQLERVRLSMGTRQGIA